MANECNPGVVSPPVAATWIVLAAQSNPSGLPCGPGAVILVRLQGGEVSSLLKPFQSPAKTILEAGVPMDCHKGSIICASHCPYNWAKFWLSPTSVAKLKS